MAIARLLTGGCAVTLTPATRSSRHVLRDEFAISWIEQPARIV